MPRLQRFSNFSPYIFFEIMVGSLSWWLFIWNWGRTIGFQIPNSLRSRLRCDTCDVKSTIKMTSASKIFIDYHHSLSSTAQSIQWEEIFIDQGSSSAAISLQKRDHEEQNADYFSDIASSEGERIQQGKSVILLHNIVDEAECKDLVDRCVLVSLKSHRSELEHSKQKQDGVNCKPSLVRLPTRAAARRAKFDKIPCAEPLPEYIDYRLQRILQRVCEAIDAQLPSLSLVLFQTDSLANLLADSLVEDRSLSEDALKFSAREPAINVYSAPDGEFLPHKDDEALTVLLPLSSPEIDFEEGGTAFWCGQTEDGKGSKCPPNLILRPPAGTALLFGGTVTHAGLSISEGSRVVFVCSFSRTAATALADPNDDDSQDALNILLQNAASDWHEKWASSSLRDSCPD